MWRGVSSLRIGRRPGRVAMGSTGRIRLPVLRPRAQPGGLQTSRDAGTSGRAGGIARACRPTRAVAIRRRRRRRNASKPLGPHQRSVHLPGALTRSVDRPGVQRPGGSREWRAMGSRTLIGKMDYQTPPRVSQCSRSKPEARNGASTRKAVPTATTPARYRPGRASGTVRDPGFSRRAGSGGDGRRHVARTRSRGMVAHAGLHRPRAPTLVHTEPAGACGVRAPWRVFIPCNCPTGDDRGKIYNNQLAQFQLDCLTTAKRGCATNWTNRDRRRLCHVDRQEVSAMLGPLSDHPHSISFRDRPVVAAARLDGSAVGTRSSFLARSNAAPRLRPSSAR